MTSRATRKARREVLEGKKERTKGGLTSNDIVLNKGRPVSKKKHEKQKKQRSRKPPPKSNQMITWRKLKKTRVHPRFWRKVLQTYQTLKKTATRRRRRRRKMVGVSAGRRRQRR